MKQPRSRVGASAPSAEALLLSIACLSPRARAAVLRQLSVDEWRTLGESAAHHGLAPLLWLDAWGADPPVSAPREIGRRLQDLYLHSELRHRAGRTQAAEVLGALALARISVIVLKGLHLTAAVYQDPAVRPMSDHDLLVRREDLSRVGEVLRRLGFGQSTTPTWCPGPKGHHHEIPFVRQGALPVEIHQHLIPRADAFRLDMDGVWSRSLPARVCGVGARVLAPEDLLHHLVLHMAWTHRFDVPLLALRDVATTLSHYRAELDWEVLAGRIEREGTEALVRVTLAFVHGQTGAPMPDSFRKYTGADIPIDVALDQYVLGKRGPQLPVAVERAPPNRRIAAALRAVTPRREELARVYGLSSTSWRIFPWYLFRWVDLLRRHGRVAWMLARRSPHVKPALVRDAARRTVEEWLERTVPRVPTT